jgi:hypothetical protein
MRTPSYGYGALLGALFTAPLLGLLFLGQQLIGLPFIPFTLFDWLTRVLPGPLVTFGLDSMIAILRSLGMSVAVPGRRAHLCGAVYRWQRRPASHRAKRSAPGWFDWRAYAHRVSA